jgi:pimeloyl-ACP methyl ester carboxylesterase
MEIKSQESSCPGPSCPDAVTACSTPLDEAFDRFKREAVRGECHTGRYRCRYYSWGRGAPVLFIPGFMDDGESFILLAAALAQEFRCIAYDLPTGKGDAGSLKRYTHKDLVDDAFALLDHLGIEQSYVFGSSFGSTIALSAMHSQPKRIARAVLQGGFARRPLALAEVLLARLGRYLPGQVGALPFRTPMLRYIHGRPFAGQPPEVWKYFVARSNAAPITAAAHRALLIHQVDLRPILAEIRQPVLLLCGDSDPLVGRRCEEMLVNGLPSADRIEIADCGHNPLFTHPELVAEIVRRFLTPPSA